jgi:uncharacterized protein
MPTRDEAPLGAPCWSDLMTSDPERARAFYCELLGWVAEEPNTEFGGYWNFTRNGVRVAGGMAKEAGNPMPDLWSVYLATDDAEKTVEQATARGADVIVPPMPVGDLGVMAVVATEAAGTIGMWEPREFRGFGLIGEQGAPGWFELHTRDHAGALAFYREVFGWETRVEGDSDEFRYTVVVADGEDVAGVMDASSFLPEGVPAHWSVYYAVDDTDATLATLDRLGGAKVMGPDDTPYGRLATVTDPMGAVFKLVGPNDQMPARS